MSILIGHARGGDPMYTPGDQSGGEVRTQGWYDLHPDFVLRPKSAAVAEKMARACEAGCVNNNIGYSQTRRNDLRAAARAVGWNLSNIKSPADCDCSSFMAVCAECAGVNMTAAYSYGNAPWTGNMREKFIATGAFDVLTDGKYLTSDRYLKRGDILVNQVTHTAMALSNGSKSDSIIGKPMTGSAVPNVSVAGNASAEPSTPGINKRVHVVIPGDTLWGISQVYGVTVAAICAANRLDPVRYIYPGQKLVIPG